MDTVDIEPAAAAAADIEPAAAAAVVVAVGNILGFHSNSLNIAAVVY